MCAMCAMCAMCENRVLCFCRNMFTTEVAISPPQIKSQKTCIACICSKLPLLPKEIVRETWKSLHLLREITAVTFCKNTVKIHMVNFTSGVW